MPKTSLALLKKQLNLDSSEDDELLLLYLGAAEQWIASYTGWGVFDGDPVETQAALMLCAHWYSNREAAQSGSLSSIPFSITELLASRREAFTG